jgi:NhaP-type Na+/H+ or K+/H+ antiporter
MWSIAGILVIAVFIAAIEVPSLLGKKRELWVFSILLLLGTGLSIAKTLHAYIPNPLDWMAAVYQPLRNWITSALK